MLISTGLQRHLIGSARSNLPVTFVSTPRVHALNERTAAVAPAVIAGEAKLKVAPLEEYVLRTQAPVRPSGKGSVGVIGTGTCDVTGGITAASVARITQLGVASGFFYMGPACGMSLFSYND